MGSYSYLLVGRESRLDLPQFLAWWRRPRPPKPATAQRILDVAEELVQVRGFNAFSYADVAGELGITKAGLHYHYPSKAELGQALVARYASRFAQALAAIDERRLQAPDKLAAYTELYAEVFRGERMCLCGMLAADYQTLPPQVKELVLAFFDESEGWLASVLEQGSAEGTLSFDGPVRETAQALIGGLEGAMLLARPYGDLDRFSGSVARLLKTVQI